MNPLLLFLGLPLLEIAVFVEVGSLIGTGTTILLILLSMAAGGALLRAQGQAVLQRFRAATARGEPPAGAAFDTFCAVAAAILLIVPGFITDLVAIALLIPPVRAFLGRWLFRQFAVSRTGRSEASVTIIDAEFRTVDEDEPPRPPTSLAVLPPAPGKDESGR